MNLFKEKVFKLAGCGVLIFIFGIIVGRSLSGLSTSSIQGFLFNAAGYATSTNATSCNATNSNATSCNATSANATTSNATSANVSADNIIYLQNISFATLTAKPSESVYMNYSTIGAVRSGMSITIANEKGNSYTLKVDDFRSNTYGYFVLPDNVAPGIYSIKEVLLIGLNTNNTTFSKLYTADAGVNSFKFDSTLTIIVEEPQDDNEKNNNSENSEQPKIEAIKLNNISLDKDVVVINDKVNINIDSNVSLKELKLNFVNGNEKLVVYANSLGDNPYFEIPSTAVVGIYQLSSVSLTSEKSSKTYSRDKVDGTTYFAFNTSLEIKEAIETKYIYNNEDITSEILAKLYDAPVGSEIIINANSKSIISEELFNTIKGKNKKLILNYFENQIIFDGGDITNSKIIDASIKAKPITSNTDIGNKVEKGIVLSFADNGNLPGKSLIRIKVTDELKNILGDSSKIYLYHYNQSSNDFTLIDTVVSRTSDGYYEFNISHNSDYILVDQKLASSLLAKTDSNVVSFVKSNQSYLMIVGIGLVVVIGVGVAIFVMNKKGKKK